MCCKVIMGLGAINYCSLMLTSKSLTSVVKFDIYVIRSLTLGVKYCAR